MKIGITFSGGGHYLEAVNACRLLIKDEKHSIFYLTYKQKQLNNISNKVYYVTHPKHGWIISRFILLLINFFQSYMVFIREKPDLIISTGADVTLSIMLIAKLFKRKVIFIESGANVSRPSLTGKLIYKFSDLFIIQWEELSKYYPKGIYGGPLL